MVIVKTRRCRVCGADRLCPDEIRRNGPATCQACVPAQRNAHRRRWAAANPERQREYDRRWRESHPEQARETSARWKREHPEQVNEQQRMAYRMRAEREGRAVKPVPAEIYEHRYGPSTGAGQSLNIDAAPLARVLRGWVDDEGVNDHYGERHDGLHTSVRLARTSGVSARTIGRIRAGETTRVSVIAADRLALAMGTHLDLIYTDAPGVPNGR
jgi:hypothetical protein